MIAEPIPVIVEDVEKQLHKNAEVLLRAARELEGILERGEPWGLDVTTQLNWIHTLARNRELILLELGRRGWKPGHGGGDGHVD